jgi:hypothetical protein
MKTEKKLTRVQKKALKRLNYLWGYHDKMEREIIRLERHFTDAQLDSLLERGELV